MPDRERSISLQRRREFCSHVCQLAALGAMAGVVVACGGGSPTAPSGASSLPVINATRTNGLTSVTVDAGSPLASAGSVAMVQASSALFLVARTSDDAFTALTATCTHAACTITGFAGSMFVCPCHGSEFSTTGAVVRGPASRPLQQCATSFANGVLTITG